MRQRTTEVLIKKYANRRLYDTAGSRYITLDELAEIIRTGKDVRIVDAKTNEDLTQVTLAQMILENGRTARLLPLPLLIQLVRMSDDALAEFFGRYMTWALELYQQAKSGAAAIAPFNPFATLPFAATNALARFWGQPPTAPWGEGQPPRPPPHPDESPPQQAAPPPVEPEPPTAFDDDTPTDPDRRPNAKKKAKAAVEDPDDPIAALRRELAELRKAVLEKG